MTAFIDCEATLVTGPDPGAWTYAVVPDAAAAFGTRRPVRTVGTIDDEPVEVTLLPLGDGTHMLPVNAKVRSRLGKQAGDRVRARLQVASGQR